MIILDIINEVCDVAKHDRFDIVYGNADPDAQTMLSLAKDAGDEISRRVDWRKLIKQEVLLASPSDLPEDFQRVYPGGAVITSAGEFVRPVTNEGQWAVVSAIPSAQPYFYLSSTGISVSPPSAAVNAALLYISTGWIKHDDTTTGVEFTGDDDEPVFPSELLQKGLLWRWRRQKGYSYDDHLAEFEADLDQQAKADRGVA
ncbi:hypothetical protein AB3480_06515 [Rhizobium mongolense]|uniref:phage adaptor protein n=1 Tax=Rhizobium mongolense TaxID=57676 RepID=UPI0034A4470E